MRTQVYFSEMNFEHSHGLTLTWTDFFVAVPVVDWFNSSGTSSVIISGSPVLMSNLFLLLRCYSELRAALWCTM